jgi:hypothetical protein
MARRLTGTRRRALIGAVVAVIFLAALVGWASGPGTGRPKLSPQGERALGVPALTPTAPATSSSASPGSRRSSRPPGAAATSEALDLPALPESTRLNEGAEPPRSVTMSVTSDAAILRLGYLVRGGRPDRYETTNAASPAIITTVGHGYGPVAEVGAQASPYATYLTCTISVDGRVTSRHTVHGPWRVLVCVG